MDPTQQEHARRLAGLLLLTIEPRGAKVLASTCTEKKMLYLLKNASFAEIAYFAAIAYFEQNCFIGSKKLKLLNFLKLLYSLKLPNLYAEIA